MRLAGGVLLWALLLGPCLQAQNRLIVVKLDGVNADFVEHWMAETDPRTGRSLLPWMQEIFAVQGVRVENFYVRGISLSAPSWAELDTGQHQIIRGNAEFDRWTLHSYDYLNFFPFYVNYPQKKQVDMPGTEVLDEAGVPLVVDSFGGEERRQSYQLYQRGTQWNIVQNALPNHLSGKSPSKLLDEWQTGFEAAGVIYQEIERELLAALPDPSVRYLDYFSGEWDHVAHLTNDPQSQLRAMQHLDALIGRIWTANQATASAPNTVMVVVSDHGMNTDPKVLSQGYDLVSWLNSTAGGAHHVMTNRHPLGEYKLRGLDPFVHKVITPSPQSAYLKSEAQHYPTALLDLDGNERAAVQLRANDWNVIQILQEAVKNAQTSPELKAACLQEMNRRGDILRARWTQDRKELLSELDAQIAARVAQAAKKGSDEEAIRVRVRAANARVEERQYRAFIKAMDAFVQPDGKEVPMESLGDRNSLFDLQNYVTGPAEKGLVLLPEGGLDVARSFRTVNYFSALQQIRVRNVVQAGLGNQPVDFMAMKIDTRAVEAATGEGDLSGAVWLYGSEAQQCLILWRERGPELSIRYLPVQNLRAAPDGTLKFDPAEWHEGVPLRLWEDDALPVRENRAGWLSSWHSERDWLAAVHRTRYSNGLVSLVEQFRPVTLPGGDRLEQRKRELVQPDFMVFAANHWNFNVRNFNPGGNHGSFLRASTHSLLMFSGGTATGVPRGKVVEPPYDSLNFAPTLLKLSGRKPVIAQPGGPIEELFPSTGIRAEPPSIIVK